RALAQHDLAHHARRRQQQAIAVLERLRTDDAGDLAQLAVALQERKHLGARPTPALIDLAGEPGLHRLGVETVARARVHGRELALVREVRIERPQRAGDAE